MLRDRGVSVARATVVESRRRLYLLSDRFDRVGFTGRRHVVSIGAMHAAFVADAYRNWAWTCEALARQRRLSALDATRAAALLRFGRLIGNTDMHSGNLSVIVQPGDLARGRAALAPMDDMLPMRWRPDAALGGAPEYSPFVIDDGDAASAAAAPARAYWSALSLHPHVSRALRRVAADMTDRL